jgi:hypothetical protein
MLGTIDREAERLKDENRYLQNKVDEYREQEDRRQHDWSKQRQRALAQQREQMRQAQCEAESWPEAFSKNIARCKSELASDEALAASDPEYGTDGVEFWKTQIEATKRARVLYEELDAVLEAKRRELAEIERTGLAQIAYRLDVEIPKNHIADALRLGEPSELVNW